MHRSTAAELSGRDENISRTRLPCFIAQAASGFELCTQCMQADRTKKGFLDSVVARKYVRVIFT